MSCLLVFVVAPLLPLRDDDEPVLPPPLLCQRGECDMIYMELIL